MIHCDSCHFEVKGMASHISKCVPLVVDCELCRPNPLTLLVREHIRKNGKIDEVHGVFGDVIENIGFVEKYENKNGWKTKFYGVSVPYHGIAKSDVIDSMATVKRVLMVTAKYALKYKYFLIFLLPFWRKSVKEFLLWFTEIYDVDLRKKTWTYLDEFSPFPRELIRAGVKLSEKIPLTYPKEDGVWNKDGGNIDRREFRFKVQEIFWCIGTFIQFDSAYYWRVQDPLSNLNKNNDTRKEIIRLFDLALEREQDIKGKILMLKKVASLLLLFPPFKSMVRDYLQELDVDKLQPDESDVYFAGRRQCYNFQGKPLEVRRKEAEDLDKSLGNVII